MYIHSETGEVLSSKEAADENSGLFIRTRGKESVKVEIPEDRLAF